MPLLFAQQSPVIGIWKITEPWQDMLELFSDKAILAEEVRQIQSDKRKQEWLAVRLLVKQLAGSEIPVCYKENGAPFLLNSLYNISISHTTGYAAVILSKNPHPGIDIEYRSERAWKLRQRFMGEEELTFLNGEATLATLCWCAKETAFKSLQASEVDFIDHLHISPFAFCEKGSFPLKETKTNQQNTYIIHYQTSESFIVTWIE
jgi:phosphopantetheinyl transferase